MTSWNAGGSSGSGPGAGPAGGPEQGYGQPAPGYATPGTTSPTGGVDFTKAPPSVGPGVGAPQHPTPTYTPGPGEGFGAGSPDHGLAGTGAAGHGAPGSVGQVRSTGLCIVLAIVTLGVYGLYWYYKVHEEMKRHTGTGLGGPIALVIAFFIGIISPYLTSSEVGDLYKRRGQEAPVSGLTGLWYFPGVFILVGPLIWFVKTNGALNDYWRSLGATG